jgi:hypothetical protein
MANSKPLIVLHYIRTGLISPHLRLRSSSSSPFGLTKYCHPAVSTTFNEMGIKEAGHSCPVEESDYYFLTWITVAIFTPNYLI